MDDSFILRIILEALDNASPTIERVTAELEALKRAGGGADGKDHPTAAVTHGLDDTGRAARDAEAATRRHREETERSTSSQRDHGRATSASGKSLDDYTRSSKDAAAAQQKLADKGRGLIQMVDALTKSMEGQRTMSQQQRLDAQRLSQELQNLSRSYKATSDGARLFAGEAEKLRQTLAFDQDRVKQDIALKAQQVNALNRVMQARQKEADAEIRAAREIAAAHADEQKSINDLVNRYQAFHKAISDGEVGRKDVVRGLQDFGRELRSLSRGFEAGSREAMVFGRMADQAVRQSKESIPDATSGIARLANRFDDWGLKIVSVSAKLRGLALAAMVGFAQQLDTAIVGLAGALISVGSAAAMAAAGIGGALVSAIGQAIPAITVFVGVLERLKLIFKAVQAQGQLQQQQSTNTAQAAASAASAHAALINAQNNLKNSYVSLADAQDRVKQAQLGLTDARIQAQRQLVDLVLAEKSAQLAALGASLSLQQAQQQLQQTVLTGGTGTTLEAAQLQVQQAQLGVRQAAVNVPRSRFDAERAADLGISGSPQVVGAAQSLRSARAGVGQARSSITSAQLALRQAHLQAQTAAATAAPAEQQLDYLLGRMDSTERRLFDTISKLVNLFRGPNTPLSKATDAIIKPFADAIDKIYAILSNAKNPITRALNNIGTAVGGSLGQIEKMMFSKQGQSFFRMMAEDAAKNLPVIISSFGHIAKIFMDIAKAAAPVLKFLIDGFNQWISGVDKSMSSKKGMQQLQDFFKSTIPYIRSFLDLGKALADLFGAIVGKAAPAGKSIIDSFTSSIQQATQWVNQHGPAVRQFFMQSAQVLSTLGVLIFQIAKAMINLFDPATVKTFVTFITTYLLPAIGDALKILGFVVNAVMGFFNLFGSPGRKALEFFAAGTAALLLFGKAFDPIRKAASGLLGLLGRIGAAFEALKGGQGIKGAWTALTSKGTGTVGGTIEEAMTVGGQTAGKTIGTSMTEAGTVVADELRTAMTTGGTAAGAEIGGAETAGGTAAATEIGGAETAGGTAAAAEISAAMAAGGATAAAEIGAAEVAGGAGAGVVAGSAVGAGTGLGLGALGTLIPQVGALAVSSAIAGRAAKAITGSSGLRSTLPGFLGDAENTALGFLGLAGPDPAVQQAAQRKQQRGTASQFLGSVSGLDIANQSTAALRRLREEAQKVLDLPDITQTQRNGLKQMITQLNPANVALAKAGALWGATFQGINATTGDVMKQVRAILKTDIQDISDNLGTGTTKGASAMAATITAAYNTVLTNTSKTGKGVQAGLAAIGKMLNNALKAVGATGPGQQISLDTFSSLPAGIQTGLLSGQLTAGGVGATHASGGYEQAKPGGKIIQVAEGGYPEVVLTTDPKYADRQRGLLSRYLQEAPHVLGHATGGYVYPAGSGVSFGSRIDRGWDFGGTGPLGAIGDARVTYAQTGTGWYGQGTDAWITYQLMNGPRAGSYVYTAENVNPTVRSGRVAAGQQYAQSASSGEMGWAAGSGIGTLAQARGHQGGSSHYTPEGQDFHDFLVGLQHGVITGGASVAAAHLKSPNIHGQGVIGKIGQAGIDRVTKFANAYLQSLTGVSTVPSFASSGGSATSGTGSYTGSLNRTFATNGPDTLSSSQVQGLLRSAGFGSADSVLFDHVAYAESNRKPGEQNSIGATGLLQILLSVHQDLVAKYGDMKNPWNNVRAGHDLYSQNRMSPWEASRNAGAGGGWGRYAPPGYMSGDFIAAADGFSGVVENPTVFLTGEAGKEHVQITPMQAGGYIQTDSSSSYPSSPAVQALAKALFNADPSNSISGIFELLKIVSQAFQSLNKFSIKSSGFAKNYIPYVNSLLTQDTGVFDRLANGFNILDSMFQAAQVIGGRLASIGMPAGMRKIIEAAFGKKPQYSITKSGVVTQQMSSTQQSVLDLSGLRSEHTYLMGERDLVGTALTSVTRNMNAAQQAVNRDPKNKQLQKTLIELVTQHNDLIKRMQTLTGQVAQNVSDIFSAEQSHINNAIQDIQTRFDIGISKARRPGAISKAGIQGVAGLETQLKHAIKIGDRALQDTIMQDITSTFANTASALDTYWQTGAGAKSTNSLQRGGSYIQNVIAKIAPSAGGGATSAAQWTLGLANLTQTSLHSQISSYSGLLTAAIKSGNKPAIDQLSDKIAGLNESLSENTQVIADDTVAVRQATIDRITSQTQFQTGVLGTLYGAVQTMGQLTGGLDLPTALGITTANQSVLQGSTNQLLQQLFGATGINLTGLSGTSLIKAISGLPIQNLEQGMSASQQQQFEGLISSIVGNISALEQNTVQLQTLNGQLTQPSQWSTTAWQMFRSAIFTGMGGLLPQYQSIVPGAAGMSTMMPFTPGGTIHANTTGDTTVHAYITNPTEVADPNYLGQTIAWYAKTS